MRKRFKILLGLICISVLSLNAQDSFYLIGQIKDAQTQDGITSAHILNLNNQKITTSGVNGYFIIKAFDKDFLKVSYIGFNDLYFKALQNSKDTLVLYLQEKKYQLEEVKVYPWTKKEFKHQFVHRKYKSDTMEWLTKRINLSKEELMWITPVSFHNYKTSKERQIVKLKEMKAFFIKEEAFRKIIFELTGYKDLELEDFIRFCKFSKQYISKTQLYYLSESIRKKHLQFEENKAVIIEED